MFAHKFTIKTVSYDSETFEMIERLEKLFFHSFLVSFFVKFLDSA